MPLTEFGAFDEVVIGPPKNNGIGCWSFIIVAAVVVFGVLLRKKEIKENKKEEQHPKYPYKQYTCFCDTYRLESCEAIWNGTDLEIQYDPIANRSDFIGQKNGSK